MTEMPPAGALTEIAYRGFLLILLYTQKGMWTWAERARLTLSTFMRKVSQGQPVKSLEHHMFRLEIRRLHGDLGRLGGLFKHSLAERQGPDHELRRLLREIDMRQKELREVVGKIR